MGLDGAVVKDVADGKATLGEPSRDEQTAVAVERVAFRAHQTDP
jgi:hypothetical protein